MLLFMFFVCARSSAHGVLHAFDIGADLLRGGDAKADGAGRLGVLPHHLYNSGKVGFDLATGAGSLYRISHDLLFVFWAWHGRCFYLWNGRSVLSNKFSAYDITSRNCVKRFVQKEGST